jgi:hypothetical protein
LSVIGLPHCVTNTSGAGVLANALDVGESPKKRATTTNDLNVGRPIDDHAFPGQVFILIFPHPRQLPSNPAVRALLTYAATYPRGEY